MGFAFRSSTFRSDPERRQAFLARQRIALANGRGLGATFDLRWVTGPQCRVELGAASSVARQWLAKVLLPAYEPDQWRPGPQDGRSGQPLVVAHARPFPARELPLPDDPEPAPWSDAVVLALGVVPVGATVHWRFTPAVPGSTVVRVPEEGRVPSAGRTIGPRLPLAEPERSVRDRAFGRPTAVTWWARGWVELDGAQKGASPPNELIRVIESASKDVCGNRLGWRRAGGWWSGGAPAFPITEPELAGFLPNPWTRIRPTAGPSTEGGGQLWLGRSAEGERVGLPVGRAEGRHLLVLGETGMGKSSALVGLARQATSLGGVLLFDPVGETANSFIAALPAAALTRTLRISPVRSPVAINALEPPAVPSGNEAVGPGRQTFELVDALRRIRAGRYADSSFWGPRIEEVTRLAVGLAASIPGGTLEDAVRFLETRHGSPPTVPPATHPSLVELRQRLEERPEDAEGARRLLSEVTRNPVLHRMLCERHPRVSASELVAPGRITVLSADAAEVGESTARYLLATYLALVWSRILERPSRAKLFIVMDEAQWYAHDSAVQVLRLGRRFNVHLWTATQALGSLPEGFAEAVVTNASDLLLFRGSPDDARAFERWGTSVRVDSVLRLGRGTAALLRGKGAEVDWVSLAPLTSPAEDRARGRSLAEAARPYWPRERTPAPEDPPTAPAGLGPLDPRNASEALLLVLWAAVSEAEGPAGARIPLERLRKSADPEGELVRALGRELARDGILDESGRDLAGSYWVLRRESLAPRIETRLSPEGLAWAKAQWRISG